MSCLGRGRGLYTDSRSRPSGRGTRHPGSTPPSSKRAEHPQCNLGGKYRQALGPLVCRSPHCIGRPGHMGLVGKGCLRWKWRSQLLHRRLDSQLTDQVLCSATSCKCLPGLPWVPPRCREGKSTRRDDRPLCSWRSGCSKVTRRRRLGRTDRCRRSHSRPDHWGRCCAARRCTRLLCSQSHRFLCILRCKGTLVDLRQSCCQCQVYSRRWRHKDLVCRGPRE